MDVTPLDAKSEGTLFGGVTKNIQSDLKCGLSLWLVELNSHVSFFNLESFLESNQSIVKSNLLSGNRIHVFSTWMAFGGNTHDLGSFGEETDKITDLRQIHEEVLFTERGDDVTGIKRRRHDLSSDGIRDLATALGSSRLKEDLESST
ncbi:hypothetical protein Tco_1572601 [Tanacetum coccineum]